MLKRRIYDFLLEWKQRQNKKPLIVNGARQVGKTYIIREFGKQEYNNFLEINFILNPEMKSIFSSSLLVDDILTRLSLYFPNFNFTSNNTLLFFDEIQKCPNCRVAFKSFAQDGRFDVIASGSLLGLHFGQDPDLDEPIASLPVGYEEQITMHSLDFEEFLWAKGYNTNTISYIKSFLAREEKVPESINTKMEELIKEYIVVGGMPEVVVAFLSTNNYGEVHRIQENILASYIDDITNHSKSVDGIKIKKLWASIPSQIAKENKKFQYSKIEKGSNKRKYESAILWIIDASFASCCYNVSKPVFPLKGYIKEDYFKLYYNDIGLLCASYGFEMKSQIITSALEGEIKGGIYENLIADILLKKGYPLFYYKEEESEKEIEFLIYKDGEVRPIEVKAKRGKTISLNSFIEKYKPKTAYKLIEGNIGRDGAKLTLPHYFAAFL